MKTQEQVIATRVYEELVAYFNNSHVQEEYVRIIRWLPSMLSQAGCDTTFEFLFAQVHRDARDKQVISALCSHIAMLMAVPEVTNEQYRNNLAVDNPRIDVAQDNAQQDTTLAMSVWRIQHYINGLSTDMYIQFVQRLYDVLVWLKRLAVAMQ
jgi:CRISPR/Cas system CMR-associated protein Cmr5 small subunit